MRFSKLIRKSLQYYWRTNVAVLLGVATAVSVLAGALLVGNSVRASLKDLFLARLGNTDLLISSPSYFPEDLVQRIRRDSQFLENFEDICPLIVALAAATHQESGRRASDVQVYGIDERFWRFHRQTENTPGALSQREALISQSLAHEIGAQSGDSILLRLEVPSEVPSESLHGRKDGSGRSVRLSARQILPMGGLGEFSLMPQQGSVHTVFVPLRRLQKELGQENRVNTLLVAHRTGADRRSPDAATTSSLAELLKRTTSLEDLGIRLQLLEKQQTFALERASTLLGDDLIAKAQAVAARLSLKPFPILTYLANRIQVGARQIPYSLVTAIDEQQFMSSVGTQPQSEARKRNDDDSEKSQLSEMTETLPPIWINEWASRDLNAKPGDRVTLEYYVWKEEGRLVTQTSGFQLAASLPIQGFAADRDVAPEYPGISDSDTLSDWDPPFPMDLGLIRPKDEDYWKRFRTTPKAFIRLAEGQELWKSRFGSLTSLRFYSPAASSPPNPPQPAPTLSSARRGDLSSGQLSTVLNYFREALRAQVNPLEMGFVLTPVRAQGLAASQGATDFGEYFTYFSFFLVVSALLLSTLFFRLGIEQRLREIGLLKALGFSAVQVRNLFLAEGALLSVTGSLAALLGALAYSKFILFGLRTWWLDAVGTTHLTLHVSPLPLALGACGGVLSSLACIGWTLRKLVPVAPRALLAGSWQTQAGDKAGQGIGQRRGVFRSPFLRFSPLKASFFAGSIGVLLVLAAALERIGPVAGFFGAGSLLLIALVELQAHWLGRPGRSLVSRQGLWGILALGFRNATHRPGRSILSISLIAFAAFIIVAVEAFRRDSHGTLAHQASGSGGFPLFAQSLLPVFHDLNTTEGRSALNLDDSEGRLLGRAKSYRFRVRPGEDTSCLNLYQPRTPRILAPTDDFLSLGRFRFQSSMASDEAEKRNPWLLLQKQFPDGAIPVIGDANSLTYVLHLKLGQDWILPREGAAPLRLRIVAALADSLFQRELLMSELNFKRYFPEVEGYRFFLIELDEALAAEASQRLEERLADYGFDVVAAAEQLARFHRVENTYLSTFQAIGGLGLLLGTVGLAIVLLRNVLERRRELALLRAVGYTRRHMALMILAENVLLLISGLTTGALCAFLAIAPALSARGGAFPAFSSTGLLLAVLLTGLTASLLATRAALRSSLLEALRAE
jgi:putative ABC transport system permease protein